MDDSGARLQEELIAMGRRAREAAAALRALTAEGRTRAILSIAAALRHRAAHILEANAADLASAERSGLSGPMLDRMALTPDRVRALADAVAAIAEIPDPVGVEMDRWQRPNGLDIARVRTPIGVIAMIYESRPNVTADAAALCLRSGNAVILRGGSECLATNLAIHAAVQLGLEASGLRADSVQMVATVDRAAVGHLLAGLDGNVDLIIPRGGRGLVSRVRGEARAPVLGHLEGLNHVFVHQAADLDKAIALAVNAKLRRVSVCGAAETLLIDACAADWLLPPIAAALQAGGCELRGDPFSRAIVPDMIAATDEDWITEYLAPIMNVALVDGSAGAQRHIAKYGSGHTDAIVTEDSDAAEDFVTHVDSAIVLVNASTQFADGGEFGFGAEIGIATDRLHARGPVGAEQLTTFKYVVRGTGQTRP